MNAERITTENFKVGAVTAEWGKSCQIHVGYEAQTGSTNNDAKQNALNETNAIALYLTDHQTAGRGRGQNSWNDSQGQTLLSSWSFILPETPRPCLTARIGLAVFRALTSTWPTLNLSLKAPNDIYLGPKKLAGLLIENVQEGTRNRLIVGLGLNVFSSPQDLATSTYLAEGLTDPQDLTADTWETFLDRLLLELTLVVRAPQSEIQSLERKLLLFSLNRFPALTEKYTAVHADGSLSTASKKINWMDL